MHCADLNLPREGLSHIKNDNEKKLYLQLGNGEKIKILCMKYPLYKNGSIPLTFLCTIHCNNISHDTINHNKSVRFHRQKQPKSNMAFISSSRHQEILEVTQRRVFPFLPSFEIRGKVLA